MPQKLSEDKDSPHQVAVDLAEFRADDDAWKAYLAVADSTSVADGIDT